MTAGVQLDLFARRNRRRKADEERLLSRLREIEDLRRPILGLTMTRRQLKRLMTPLPRITVHD